MQLKRFIYQQSTPLLLGVIVLVASFLRLYHLDSQSLWVDEISSMNIANPELSGSEVIQYSVADQPPAFFLLLHYWFKIFPYTDWYGRLLSVLLGIIGIISIFFFGKEVKNSKVGLIAAAITTFSYIHIFFSQEARFYTLVFLTSTLSYLFFIRAIRTKFKSDFIFYTISTAILIYTHYFGLVVLTTQGLLFILLIVLYPKNRQFILSAILSGIAVIILISPWIPIFFSDAQTAHFWIPREPVYFPIKYFYVYFKDYFSSVVFGLLILYYLFTRYKTFRAEKRIDPVDFVLPAGVVISFAIPVIYSILQTPMLQERYTLIALPSIIVVISQGFYLLQKKIRTILLIVTCSTMLFSLVTIEKFYTKNRKEDWRGIVAEVNQNASSGDMIISSQPSYCNYYFKSFQSGFRAILPDESHIEKSHPTGIWWLDAFELKPIPSELEGQLIQNGYVLHHGDSLERAVALYYKRK